MARSQVSPTPKSFLDAMRNVCLALTAAAFASTGCSALIAVSGRNLSDLKDRTDVQAAFGAPEATGEAEGKLFEEYSTRQKIADPWFVGPGLAMGYCMTLGLYEFVILPVELYRTGRRTLLGQRIQFTYDTDGHVTSIRWDGDPVHVPDRIESLPSER
jgi:YD repeat-containing protein